jgi:hypothetical protein
VRGLEFDDRPDGEDGSASYLIGEKRTPLSTASSRQLARHPPPSLLAYKLP